MLRSTHKLPEVLERPLSLDNTKLDVRQIIFNKYFKIISLNDVKTSKNTQRLGKISDVFMS